MASVIVGIDNGISGGLCAISAHNSAVISSLPMPTTKHNGKTEVDVLATLRYVRGFLPQDVSVAIEEPLAHAKSSQAIRSMALAFGMLYGACLAHGLPVARIAVKPWQDAMLGRKREAGMTKTLALAKANELAPDETWLASKRSSTPHDGMVDAFLIARYHLNSDGLIEVASPQPSGHSELF